MPGKGSGAPKTEFWLDLGAGRGDEVFTRIVEPSRVNLDIVGRPHAIKRRWAFRWARAIKGGEPRLFQDRVGGSDLIPRLDWEGRADVSLTYLAR